MSDLEHLDAEIARCDSFVVMLTGGNKKTNTRQNFVDRRDALKRIRALLMEHISS